MAAAPQAGTTFLDFGQLASAQEIARRLFPDPGEPHRRRQADKSELIYQREYERCPCSTCDKASRRYCSETGPSCEAYLNYL